MIRAIAAIDDSRGIAAVNHPPFNIPWDIPDDREYYKQQTLDATIVMGRHTYETFKQPLPNRRNIVLSNSLWIVREGFELMHDLDSFIETTNEDIWIIGGQGLYQAALPLCDEIYITHVQGDFNCDRFFPTFDKDFSMASESDRQQQNGYTYNFAVYKKNR